MTIIKLLEPKAHPLKFRLKKLAVKQVHIGRFLGVSTSTAAAWLNGVRPMPNEVERKLTALAQHLELEQGVVEDSRD